MCLHSFSWLCWQVHRSLAVLVKGSTVAPFHQEFQRLYSKSKPVPGFVTFITAPRTMPLHTTPHVSQSSNSGICQSQSSQTTTKWHRDRIEDVECSPELEHSKGNDQLPCGASINELKHPYPKPVVQPGTQQGVSVEKLKHTAAGVTSLKDVQTCVEPLPKSHNQIQSRTNHLSQTHVSNIQSQLASRSISTTAQRNVPELNALHTANPTHQPHRAARYQSTLKHSSLDQVGGDGLFFQERNANRLTTLTRFAAERGQWNYSPNKKPMAELCSENATLLSAPTSQTKLAKTGLQLLFSHSEGHQSGLETKVSSLATKAHVQSHMTTDAPSLKLTTGVETRVKPQLGTDSRWFFPGATAKLHRLPHTSQQVTPPPRVNWTPHGHTARPRPVARTSSFDHTYGTGQKTVGQQGWRPFHSNMTLLGRSKSLTERRTTSLNPNITTI